MSETRCQIFGLCLSVPFAVGKEMQVSPETSVDVQVSLAPVPPELPNVAHKYVYEESDIDIQVDGAGDVLLSTPTARYYVQGSRTVAIQPEPGVALQNLRYMVMHYCLPALLNQRGFFALHANAIHTPRGVVVLAGQSGGGKSTLHAALLARGLPMLSDDVAVLRSSGTAIDVLPGMRRYRMVADAADRVQPPSDYTVALGGPRNKVALWAPAELFHSAPAPLAAVYVLEPYAGDAIVVEPVRGFAAFRLLQTQAYPPLESMALPQHLQTFGALIDRLAVYRVCRPAQRWTVDELADIVLRADPLNTHD